MPRKKSIITDSYNSAFPKRLRYLMETQNVTRQDLGMALQKTRQAVGYYADGSSSPDWETIIKIAQYFRVTTDYLLGLTDSPTLNADIRQVADYTGLWGEAVTQLHNNKANEEFAEFLSFLAVHKDTIKLIHAIKNRNDFVDGVQNAIPPKLHVDLGTHIRYKMPMESVMKAVADDIFWKILEDYDIKSNRIMLEWVVSDGSNNKTNET